MAKPASGAVINPGNSLWTAMTACWPMLEGSGTTSADKSGNGHTLTFAAGGGAPTWSTDGAGDAIISMGTALATPLALPGTITIPADTSWSFAWRGKQASDANNNGAVMGSDTTSSFLAMFGSANYLGFRNSSGGDNNNTNLTNFTTDANYLVVFNDADGAGAVRFYKDGVEVAGSPSSSPSFPFVIKKLGNGYSGTTFSLVGSLTYAYLWVGRALTAGEASTLHSAPYGGLTEDPTIYMTPTHGVVSRAVELTINGYATTWQTSCAFTVSGGTGASLGTVTVVSDTQALVTLNPGTALGTLTITDTTTSATATFSVEDQFAGGILSSAFVNSAGVSGSDAAGRTFINSVVAQRIRQHGPITRIRAHVRATGTADSWRWKVFRPNGSTFDFVAQSELMTAAGTGLQTFALSTPMACQPGDVIGVWLKSAAEIAVKASSSAPGVKYGAGDQAGTGWTPSTDLNSFDLDIEAMCAFVTAVDTGDSRSAGHNGPTDYLTWLEGGPSAANHAAQPIHQLQALKDATRTDWTYQNFAKGSETWAHVAATQFPSIFTTHRLVPEYVFTQCGVNDVSAGRTNAAVLANLDTCYALVPANTTWLIDEVLPWTAGSDAQAASLRSLNTAIAGWAVGKDNVRIVSCHDELAQLRGSTGELDDILAVYNDDGVHLSLSGVDALADLRSAAISPSSAEVAATGGPGTFSGAATTAADILLGATGGSGAFSGAADSPATASLGATGGSGVFSGAASSGAAASIGVTGGSGAFAGTASVSSGGTGTSTASSTATAAGNGITSASATASGLGVVAGVGAATATAQATSAGLATATATGNGITAAQASAAGLATASAAGQSTHAAPGTSAGVATVNAAGNSPLAGAGSAAGSATATATGVGLASGVGTGASDGTSTATATGRATAAAVGSSDASATASAAGGGTTVSAGSSFGTSTAGATGAVVHAAQGSSAGVATATATSSSSVVSGAGSAVGTATATATGRSTAAADGSSGGVATATALSAAGQAAAGTAAGLATAVAGGAATVAAPGSSSGTSSATAGGTGVVPTAGAALGTASATGAGVWRVDATGTSAGGTTALGVGACTAAGAGTAAGTSYAALVQFTLTGIVPLMLVPEDGVGMIVPADNHTMSVS